MPSLPPEVFASTHWTVVLAAAATDAPAAEAAMERLCAVYWYPLYAFLRRKGLDEHAAKDLTQEFFAQRILTKKIFHGLQRQNGKFRSWLLASLRNLLANEADRQQAGKRGGLMPHLALDVASAEGRYQLEPSRDATPERLFDQAWAAALLAQVTGQLRARYTSEGKARLFEELKSFLPGEQSGRSRTEAAVRLNRNENAVNVAIHRLRQEFGQLLRAEIKRTVADPKEIDEEIRYLISVLSE